MMPMRKSVASAVDASANTEQIRKLSLRIIAAPITADSSFGVILSSHDSVYPYWTILKCLPAKSQLARHSACNPPRIDSLGNAYRKKAQSFVPCALVKGNR
jgi:hypothetical protein